MGCKKPKLGQYYFSLNENAGYYGYEVKVTPKHITYGGAYSEVNGVLEKNGNKVTGDITLKDYKNYEYTITIKGKIEHDGSLLKYKIVGDYIDASNNSGKFIITRTN